MIHIDTNLERMRGQWLHGQQLTRTMHSHFLNSPLGIGHCRTSKAGAHVKQLTCAPLLITQQLNRRSGPKNKQFIRRRSHRRPGVGALTAVVSTAVWQDGAALLEATPQAEDELLSWFRSQKGCDLRCFYGHEIQCYDCRVRQKRVL